MASIKVFDPVSVPFSVLEELQQLRAQVEQLRQEHERLRQEHERLRQENERLQRELEGARAGLDQAQRQSKRQAAPFSKGPPKPQPKTPGRKSGTAHGATATACPPAPQLSMRSWRHPCLTRALGAVAPSGKQRLPHSIRRKSLDVP